MPLVQGAGGGITWVPTTPSPQAITNILNIIANANAAAGGDISSIGQGLVSGLQGRPITSMPPRTGQVLQWNNGIWVGSDGFLAWGATLGNVASTSTTFGGGADLLSSPLSFIADGVSSYVLSVRARGWNVNNTTSVGKLNINLDGADAGQFGQTFNNPASTSLTLAAEGLLLFPAAGSHTINARISLNLAGTVTVAGGSGGVGGDSPILVTLKQML